MYATHEIHYYAIDHRDAEYCHDCGRRAETLYRQPFRGVALCDSCWEIDMEPSDESDT